MKITNSKIIGLILIGFVVLYFLARVFNLIQFYSNETPAMEPTLKKGTTMLATNLKPPARNSIVAFKVNSLRNAAEESTHVSRIIGLENETIEIKDGIVLIDGNTVDHSFEILSAIKMQYNDYVQLSEKHNLELVNPNQPVGQHAFVYMTNSEVKILEDQIDFKPLDLPISGNRKYRINKIVKKGWSTNNFGPIKVPENHFFMISDNRNNCLDSRFYGFIGKDKIIGTTVIAGI